MAKCQCGKEVVFQQDKTGKYVPYNHPEGGLHACQRAVQATTTNAAPVTTNTPAPAPTQDVLNLPAVVELRHTYVQTPELADSIEIGNPGRGGVLKVRFNAADPAEADKLVRSGYERLMLARELMESEGPAPKNGAAVLGKKNGEVTIA